MAENSSSESLRSAIASFFGNPLVGILGSVASIVAIPLAIFFYLESREIPILIYSIHPVRTSVVRAGEASNLSISHNGKKISGNVSAAQMAIWNAGKKPIRENDILSPIVISTGGGQPFLEVRIRKTSRPTINFTLDTTRADEGKLRVDWRILEKDDGAVIQLIYVGDQNVPLQVSGSIVGQRDLREIFYSKQTQRPGEQYGENIGSPLTLGAVALVMLLLCAVLFAVPWILLRKTTIGTSQSKALLIMIWLIIAVAWLYGGYQAWEAIQLWQLGQPFAF